MALSAGPFMSFISVSFLFSFNGWIVYQIFPEACVANRKIIWGRSQKGRFQKDYFGRAELRLGRRIRAGTPPSALDSFQPASA